MTVSDALMEKIRQLPPQRVAEVEDFVRLTRAAAQVSEPAFADVWDNDEDAIYDRA
jgi:hypothetical protein